MKVSIIIPVYNKSQYLKYLFTDLLNQTFTDYECLFIDDGSVDQSGQFCDEMSKKDRRFRTFHLENGGVSNARNYGIDRAKGECIAFLDADDRLHPEYLGNLYQCITDNNVDIVISGLEKFWIDSKRREYVRSSILGYKEKQDIICRFAQMQQENGIFGFCVAKMFRKELLGDIRFDPELKLAEDFDFYLKLYKKVNVFYFDDKCYYRYLQCADNSSAIIQDDKIDYMSQLMINLNYKNFLIKEAAYEGKNKEIVEKKINIYIYYVIFYSTYEVLLSNCKRLREIVDNEEIHLKGETILQKWFFILLKKKYYELMGYTLRLYRVIRKLIRKIRYAGLCK